MEMVVAQSLAGEPLGGGHPDRTAKSAGNAEPHVVDEDDKDIGRAFRGLHLEAWWRGGVTGVKHRAARRIRLSEREHGAVEARIGGEERAEKGQAERN